jgi:acetoacetyl-CoA reductase
MSKRIALVTGGIGGIGSSICRQLAEDGFTVVANYIKAEEDKARAWLAVELSAGRDTHIAVGDVSNYDSSVAMITKIRADIGNVSVLVNNAGITRDGVFKKMPLENWMDVININLNSVFNVTRLIIDDMLAQGWGRVINMSSVNGQKGQFGQTNYSAAKAGMHGFTKALALETAAKGITVNTISPGYIGTEMVMAIKQEVRDQIVSTIPVGRLGTPEEIAKLVSYLSSDNAAFITGSNIAINGGLHMC